MSGFSSSKEQNQKSVCHTCSDGEEFWSVVCVQRHDSTNSSARMRESRHDTSRTARARKMAPKKS